ncbi:TetR/AcrR family transcriptional regulator [Flaviaesturariibacter amylovorans]|uniref:HTH tetR-type domain-containing protein n=1 Tax=Flaviaesturariibacter amylovorans TaxID=1084520 RepID=A0ABP8GK39_9BACT
MSQPVRHEQILEAALKRFAHFGVRKTTLTEIAEDLSLSKQALHYYFPDKASLTRAVIAQITDTYIAAVGKELAPGVPIIKALEGIVAVRARFFRSYYPLIAQLDTGSNEPSAGAIGLLHEVLRREAGLLADCLRSAIARGEVRPMDADATATLLIETLAALSRQLHFKCLPSLADFEQVTVRQTALAHLLYNGLKNEAWKH